MSAPGNTAAPPPARALIEQAAIRHNLRVLRGCCPAKVRLCVAVKADAYGHGLAQVLPALRAEGVDMVAVACVVEGVQLRRMGWQGRVLVFGPSLEGVGQGGAAVLAESCVAEGLEPTATALGQIDRLAAAARKCRRAVQVHVKVDSGMGRMGVGAELAQELIRRIEAAGELSLAGVYTHLATADEADRRFVHEQLTVFRRLLDSLKQQGIRIPLVHAANSAATLQEPGSHFDMVRPGLAVYGYRGSPDVVSPRPLRPAMRVVSRLALVKELPPGHSVGYGRTWRAEHRTRVGVVPIGYGDGYLRWFSNRADMTIRGRLVPVIGRVSMDLTTVDLTDLPEARVGDEVVVIDNDSSAPNSVESLAKLAGTIPYEITCALGQRVPRQTV